MTDAIVCDHGATICDVGSGEILFEKKVPLDLARELIERASDDLTVVVCLEEEFYTPRISADAQTFVGNYRDHLHVVPDLAQSLRGEPQKILFINDELVTASLLVELKIRFGSLLQVVQSFPLYVELTHHEASKGNAVAWLAKRWNIAHPEVIALGDQGNDCSMIEWAGLGILGLQSELDHLQEVAVKLTVILIVST